MINQTFIEDLKDRISLAQNGHCPVCKEKIILSSFKDKQSIDEYMLSGLCQKCQDKFFE